jgi:hypothetical protein
MAELMAVVAELNDLVVAELPDVAQELAALLTQTWRWRPGTRPGGRRDPGSTWWRRDLTPSSAPAPPARRGDDGGGEPALVAEARGGGDSPDVAQELAALLTQTWRWRPS